MKFAGLKIVCLVLNGFTDNVKYCGSYNISVNYISSLFFGVSLTRCRGSKIRPVLQIQPTSSFPPSIVVETFSLFLLCSLLPSAFQVPPSLSDSFPFRSLVLSQNSTPRVHVHLLLYATPGAESQMWFHYSSLPLLFHPIFPISLPCFTSIPSTLNLYLTSQSLSLVYQSL